MSARIAPGGLREIGPAAFAFSRLAGRVMRTEAPAVFTTLGLARRTYWGWLAFSATLMPFGHLPRRESELVILRIATVRDSAYERDHHERLGRRAGLTRNEIQRVGHADLDDEWPPRERVILDAVDELASASDITDETWGRLREHLTERETIELLLLVGNYTALATTLHTLRIRPDRARARRDLGQREWRPNRESGAHPDGRHSRG